MCWSPVPASICGGDTCGLNLQEGLVLPEDGLREAANLAQAATSLAGSSRQATIAQEAAPILLSFTASMQKGLTNLLLS